MRSRNAPALAVRILASLAAPAASAPTRTHCRCVLVDTQAALSASSAGLLSTSPESSDPCANLGPELEFFRRAEPDRYQTYISQANAHSSEESLPTAVLMEWAAHKTFLNLGPVLPHAPAPTERPTERIVCQSEQEAFSAFSSSQTTLLALHVVIGVAVLACLAEFLCFLTGWSLGRKPKARRLQLTGEEQRLNAYPSPSSDLLFSPGVEKKMQAYSSVRILLKPSHQKRVSNAYEVNIEFDYDDDDEDDEMNRPVM